MQLGEHKGKRQQWEPSSKYEPVPQVDYSSIIAAHTFLKLIYCWTGVTWEGALTIAPSVGLVAKDGRVYMEVGLIGHFPSCDCTDCNDLIASKKTMTHLLYKHLYYLSNVHFACCHSYEIHQPTFQ